MKFIKYSIKEYLFAYFSIVFMVLYWNSAHTLPYEALRYPIIISVIVVVLIAANLVDSVIKFRREVAAEQQETAAGEVPEKARWDCSLGLTKKRMGTFSATLLYPVLLPLVGFLPLSVVYLFGVSFFLGIRNYKDMVLYSIVVTALLFVIFEIWLGISLPQGLLESLF